MKKKIDTPKKEEARFWRAYRSPFIATTNPVSCFPVAGLLTRVIQMKIIARGETEFFAPINIVAKNDKEGDGVTVLISSSPTTTTTITTSRD